VVGVSGDSEAGGITVPSGYGLVAFGLTGPSAVVTGGVEDRVVGIPVKSGVVDAGIIPLLQASKPQLIIAASVSRIAHGRIIYPFSRMYHVR